MCPNVAKALRWCHVKLADKGAIESRSMMVDMLRFAFRLGDKEVPIVATLMDGVRLDVAILRDGSVAETLLSVTDMCPDADGCRDAPESRIRHLLGQCISDGSLMSALTVADSPLT
jgi:hypothetical protein